MSRLRHKPVERPKRRNLFAHQALIHLAELVRIDRVGYSPLEGWRNHAARRTHKPLNGKLSGVSYPFHIKGLAAEAAARHRLRRHTGDTLLADRSQPEAQERPSAGIAISWIESRYNVIQRSPNHPSRPLEPPWRHSRIRHPAWRRTGRPPCNTSERIVIQAFAEDSPQSLALQATLTAPFLKV